MTRLAAAALLLLAVVGASARPSVSAETEVIDARTPWRAYLVEGVVLKREDGALRLASSNPNREGPFDPATAEPEKQGFSRLPPPDWMKPGYDDGPWHCYHHDDLADMLGDYGTPMLDRTAPALLLLRTSFGIDDPQKAADLKVAVTCLGGGVVYINGQEVGRAHMPAGKLWPLTPADDYPLEAYTAPNGKTPLPLLGGKGEQPEDSWMPRYANRVRKFSVSIPAKVLVKGRNVLAFELHAAAVAGPFSNRGGWSHLGFHDITLTSAAGQGVVPYAEAIGSARAWTVPAEQQVTDAPPANSLVRKSMFKTLVWTRGMPVKGVQFGNPFDPPRPLRMAAPRNGTTSAQAVLSDPKGLTGVTAAMGPLRSDAGAVLPAGAVQVRFAAMHPAVHYCDALMPEPPREAKAVPVWLIVEVPKEQPCGWYTGTLTLAACGKTFPMPVQLLVTGYTLPPARQLEPIMGVAHSPDTIAAHYKVEPWSDEHFRLMERSLAMLGQLGNDVLQVPVLTRNQFNWRLPLVRFVKTASGLKPDFALLRRYLDLYEKHCAPPRAMTILIWDRACAGEVANVYENRQLEVDRTFVAKSPPMVQVWDPKTGAVSEEEIPRLGAPEGEPIYKPLLRGIHEVVTKRGWPASCILIGLGGDIRPSKNAAATLRAWAPYARWDLLSHFSGDPGQFYKGPLNDILKSGRFVATGELEVGLKEHPYLECFETIRPAARLEQRLAQPIEYIDLPTMRWHWQDYSPPLVFRTVMHHANPPGLGRVGLDFWATGREAARNTSYFTASSSLTAPGPNGAIPTVRFQMMRQGVQEAHLRMAIVRGYAGLPEEQKQPYRDLLDELARRVFWGRHYLSQHELAYDWPAYVARLQEAAAELAGVKAGARWEQPPK